MYVQLVPRGHGAYFFLVVGCFPVGIDAVGKDFGFVTSFSKEGKVDGTVAWCPVGHGGDVPDVSLAACQCKVFAYFTVQCHGLVENGRHFGNEVRAFLLLHIFAGAVGKHLQRGFEEGVHRHLVDARTLAHRMVVDGTEGFAGCVHHGSRCVVHRADKHAQVGSSHVIAWEVVERATVHYRFPFGILQSLYTFKV